MKGIVNSSNIVKFNTFQFCFNITFLYLQTHRYLAKKHITRNSYNNLNNESLLVSPLNVKSKLKVASFYFLYYIIGMKITVLAVLIRSEHVKASE